MTVTEALAIHSLIVAMLDEHGKWPKDATQAQREDRANKAFRRLLEVCEPEERLLNDATPINDLELSVRTKAHLATGNCKTVGEIKMLSDEQFKALKMPRRSVKEIQELLGAAQ